MGAKCALVVLVFATAFLFSGCGEALTGCKDGNPLLFYSSYRDVACPEEPTDAVDNVQITQNTDTEGQVIPNQVILEWNNPAQIDLNAIEVRWTKMTETASQPRAITSAGAAIDTAETSNGIVRIPNARPKERMRQAFNVQAGYAYRFRIASIDEDNNVSLVQQTHYVPAPTDVRAQIITEGAQQAVLLTWTGVQGATEYYIDRSTDGINFNRLASTKPATYKDPIVPGVTHIYRIRAVINNGDSAPITEGENSVVVRATGSVAAPNAPTDLDAEGQDNAVELTWDVPNGGGAVNEYRVYRVTDTDINAATTHINSSVIPSSIFTYTDNTAVNDTEYTYSVRAVNASGIESANNETVTVTPRATLGAPQNFTATPGNGTVTLEWDAPDGDDTVLGYRIYRALGANINVETPLSTRPETLPPAPRSYTDTNVTNNVQYTYLVRAVNANNMEGAASDSKSAIPRQPAGTPTDLKAESLDGSVRLEWARPDSGGAVTEYRIYRATGADISGATRLTPPIDPVTNKPAKIITTTYTDESAANGAQYTYAVRAVNANDVESGNSDPVTATPLAAPGVPKNFSATPGNGTVMLEWDAPDDDSTVSGYRVYRATGATIGKSPLRISGPNPIPRAMFTDVNAPNGAQYTYVVRSVNRNGLESADSDEKRATPRSPEGAPESLTARFGDERVELTWTAPKSGGAPRGYHVYRAEGDAITDTPTRINSSIIPSSTRTYTDSPVANGAQYTYVVRAVSASNIESLDSPVRTGRPLAPPGAPANFKAEAGSGSVKLTWDAPTSGGPVDEYRVYRVTGTDISQSLSLLATLNASPRAYTDTTVRDGTQYSYAVRAVNANDAESANSTVAATPLAPPNPPASLIATAGRGSVTLTWPASVGGISVSGYAIYRAIGFDISQADEALHTVPVSSASVRTYTYTDNDVTNGIRYSYAVRAVNANGTESRNRPVDVATPLARPNAPTSLNAAAGNGTVTLTWNAPTVPTGGGAVTEYRVYRAVGSTITNTPTHLAATSTIAPPTRTYTDTSAANGTQYTYAVRAVNANDTVSANSNTDTATPLAPPNAPTNLIANAGNGTVTLTWSAPAIPAGGGAVTEYRIYRATGDSISGATPLTPPTDPVTNKPAKITTTTYTDRSAANDTQYTYAVRAVNINGAQSANSNTRSANPLAPPDAPTNLTAADGNRSVTLSWNAPTSGSTVTEYYIYRATGTDINTATRLRTSSTITTTTYTDSGLTNDTQYTYAVRAVNAHGTESANSTPTTARPRVVPSNITLRDGGAQVMLNWSAPIGAGVTEYYILRTVGGGTEARLTTNPAMLATTTYTDRDVTAGTTYHYRIQAVSNGTAGEISARHSITLSVDRDHDSLIDIYTLNMLDHIRYNLSGTSYKTSAGASGVRCGATGTTACTGYELMRDLDFATASSYANDTVNMAWRPTASSSVVAPDSATNSGWQPIGDNTTPFATLFEGNGRSISNLYSRNTANTTNRRTGLFGRLNGTLRNLLIEDSNVYGGSGIDHIGIAVGINYGIISNVAVRGGSAHGGNGRDDVGGLVGQSLDTIVASSSSAAVYGDDGAGDSVGSLVGRISRGAVTAGTVTASYATGTVDGGKGDDDYVGGLVGRISGGGLTTIIRTSYATGSVNGGDGADDYVGGLIGSEDSRVTIIASYATGNVDGGAGTGDRVGKLIGTTGDKVTASYGFGTLSGGETTGHDGSALPSGDVTTAAQLTAPGSAAATAVPAVWNQASSHTRNVWHFGTNSQTPALRYADYDSVGSGTDYCASFSSRVPGATDEFICGLTFLPGQNRAAVSRSPFDLTVSSTHSDSFAVLNTPFTLTATVENPQGSHSSPAATLTYYHSTDDTINIGTDTQVGTDAISTLGAGMTDMQEIAITLTSGGTHYYYACVVASTAETNTSNNCSNVAATEVISPVDSDNDRLIEIRNLDMLDHIRYNLAGTSYKGNVADRGVRCGTSNTTTCIGYELMRDLDFAVDSDYASGSVNTEWRPTGSTPGNATNSGWHPIGNNTTPFTTLFEGNGYKISNLYLRNTANIFARSGLFSQMSANGTLRNLLIESSNVYGGSGVDRIGMAVGEHYGTISNVVVRGGSVRGGNGHDIIGGLVGLNYGPIIASSSTAAVYGDGGNDVVGGLVGSNGGTVTASYATGAVDGGTDNDTVGGLVGSSNFVYTATIRASYALGTVNANDGDNDRAGGLVGFQNTNATIIASYATGDVDGGAGTGDDVGKLVGMSSGTITASYGFGTTSGGETAGNDGSTLPSGVTTANQLTAPGSAVATAAPAAWNQASSHTRRAWSFGTHSQTPALRYADYDYLGSGTDYCASFSSRVPGATGTFVCGLTFLPGQSRTTAASRSPFDLTVPSIDSDSFVLLNTPFTLTATVENAQGSHSSPLATLTYYRSSNGVRNTATDTTIGTDTISTLSAGVINRQYVAITLTTVGTYYYYACVLASATETDTTNNCSDVTAIEVIPPVDSDNDRLIEIRNLDMLNNIRYNLNGTSYKGNVADSGIKCGTGNTTDCIGYELMRDLDFAVASSYASGSINMEWRPTAGGRIVAPSSATNSGWQPIGDSTTPFATLFEGNGYRVRNLYSRNTVNTHNIRTGLFGQIHSSGTLRNLLIEDGNVYGGSTNDYIGVAVGASSGTIVNVAVRGGSTHGGNGYDRVGGLVGWSRGTVVSSSSTAVVYGDGHADSVGGLVGHVERGSVTASYASGAIDGGTDNDTVGGLVGYQTNSTIRASYATGTVNANTGAYEYAGGLVGLQTGSATVIASYATGNVDGGAGGNDRVGKLTGSTSGTITASYGFGTLSGGETAGHDGSTRPSGVTTAPQLTAPGSAAATAAPAVWNQMTSSTLNAWDFGTGTQAPALRYADYDGTGGVDYCAQFGNIPGTSTAITCGTTLLPGQR